MERIIALSDGSSVLIRHISPDDSASFNSAFKKITPNDIRNRFFSFVKELDPTVLHRLTNVDPELEIALVAVNAHDPKDIWAGGRLFIDLKSRRAEYAAMVRSDRQGMGLGHAMMETLIECGRQRELVEIWGMVLSKNRAMLTLANRLGFEIRRDADDVSMKIVTKDLSSDN